MRQQPDANDVDTLRYTLKNTNHQFIILPYPGFSINAANGVDKGMLVQNHSMVFDYIPNKGASGTDNFLFETGTGKKRLVIIKLINKVQNSTSVRDDKFYTPKNTPIHFDVLANDLSSNFPITTWSSALVHDTLGLFSYTPPTNFSGEKNFTYTVYYGGGYSSVGKIKIFVGNFKPQQTLDYNFNTDKNTSLVLEYDVPIEGYSFEVADNPNFGTLEVFNDNTTLDIDCNVISAKSYLVYTPDMGYYGTDSLAVTYKVVNNDSIVYKLYINILDSAQDSLCKCVGADCIWQGDMNGDGRVSVQDLLSLGRYIGLKGNNRDNMEYPYWAGQKGEDWIYTQPNGTNTKHVDADGDGIVSVSDSLSISNNYGGIHNLVPDEILGIKDYAFTLVPNSTELDSGDLLVIDILIGTSTAPVVDVFGLAFGLNFSPSLIDSASLSGHFETNGWFGRTSPTLQMMRQPQEGKVHMAFTRTGSIVDDEADGFRPIGVSGNGKIGQLSFIVEDELDGFKSTKPYITRRIKTENIGIELSEGERYLLPDTYVDVRINLDKSTPTPTEDKLLVFPNPAKQVVNLHFNGRNIIKAYKMADLYGNIVSQQSSLNDNALSILTASYPSGIYVLQVQTSQGLITKKVEIITN
ncbi:MAG: T9SS type A sorting domain-containing protein [Saprospiraceae bacterium]|nr:T9SS type A sorting domain-containing protein [Saprospiraceae bacterium]